MDRRNFIKITGGTLGLFYMQNSVLSKIKAHPELRPNILWIVTEDINDDLGCYGNKYSYTPNLDKFASQGARFTNVYDHSGVCAPTRAGIITCMYPSAIGTANMRSNGVPPPYVKGFPEFLREAGYYCTNNSKTDYNFTTKPDANTVQDSPISIWDENGHNAHWRNRPKDKPFFSVFNINTTHEGQIRLPEEKFEKRISLVDPKNRHKASQAVLPPYYPDTPVVRKDWAKYFDLITEMDLEAKKIVDELEEDGLAENTVVFFYGDNGRGLPRAKRWIYDSGIKMGLLVRWPGKIKPDTVIDDPVAFVDLGATVLSLAGVKTPKHFHGVPFLGEYTGKKEKYIFAARDRMDERYDVIRAVRDKKFKYIRNFMPHLTYAQYIEYAEQMPTMQEWRRLNNENKLNETQKIFFKKTKPVEELYDITVDPYEINNLADNAEYSQVLKEMREELLRRMSEIGDTGLIPEPVLQEMMRPGDRWQKTAEPIVSSIRKKGEKFILTLDCETEGASIVYRMSDKKQKWNLYSEPIIAESGTEISLLASRIGFLQSDEVKIKVNSSLTAAPRKDTSDFDWKNELLKSNLLNKLIEIKNLDLLPKEKALPRLFENLTDDSESIKYWAVIGIHYRAETPDEIGKAKTELGKLIFDQSPVVRIAAAQALCGWDGSKKYFTIILNELKNSSETVRLHAIIALDELDKKIKNYLPQIDLYVSPDDWENVLKVKRHIMKKFE